MDITELLKQITTLGAAGVLAYIYMQFQSGKIHSDTEIQQLRADHVKERDQQKKDLEASLEYREKLRLEISNDRRAADARVDALTQAIRESNQLTRRTLDFNERLVAELVMGRGNTRSTDVQRDDT